MAPQTRDVTRLTAALMDGAPPGNEFANPNPVLAGETRGDWSAYAELLQEPQVFACMAARRMALLGRPWRLEGGDDDLRALTRTMLRRLELPQVIGPLMDAIILGFKAAELIWRPERDWWHLEAIRIRPNDRFAFDGAGSLHIVDPATGERRPEREEYKFCIATYGPADGNRYGRGLGEVLYYLTWFKRENVKFWLIFNDKHSMPTPVAVLPESATDEELSRMKRELARLKEQTVLVHRAGVELRLLEADRNSSMETFQSIISFCNEEIAKVILGQTLTTATPAGGTGSYALGRVHHAVRMDILAGDVAWVESWMNRVVRWIADLNAGVDAEAPRFVIDLTEPHPEEENRS